MMNIQKNRKTESRQTTQYPFQKQNFDDSSRKLDNYIQLQNSYLVPRINQDVPVDFFFHSICNCKYLFRIESTLYLLIGINWFLMLPLPYFLKIAVFQCRLTQTQVKQNFISTKKKMQTSCPKIFCASFILRFKDLRK